MKIMTTFLGAVLITSTAMASEITCNIKVVDSSEVGRIENAKEQVVKAGSSSNTIEKGSAEVLFSLPANEWHDYATFIVNANVENGKITSARISDEIKNISIPMSVSSNGKSAKLSYLHGGVLVDQIYEILNISANCEIK